MLRDLNKYYSSLLLFTIVLAGLIFFWGLGSLDLMSLNEGRRALAIKEMVTTQDWLLPHLNGELYLTKPPLLYWLSSSFASIGGINEWTIRLPSALAAVATLCMVYQYTRKQSSDWAALFSIQLLMANIGFSQLGRRAEIEMLLTALCVGAILSAIQYIHTQSQKKWIYLSYFLLGLAMMAKGPVALLFVTVPLITAAIITKSPAIKDVLLNWRGWLIFLVVGLAWYAIVTWKLGFDIWSVIAKRDMLEKMQSGSAKPLLSYAGWIAVDFMFLIGLFFVRFKQTLQEQSNNQLDGKLKNHFQHLFKLLTVPEKCVLIMAVIMPFILFSLFSNKHAKYLLPIYPFIAILLGIKISNLLTTAKDNIKTLFILIGLLLTTGFAIYYLFFEPRIFAYRVAVFPAFKQWLASNNQPALLAYKSIDNRLIYYANKPIKIVSDTKLKLAKNAGESFFVLAENDEKKALEPLADCLKKEFKPYLKQQKTLSVFGFGKVCSTN